MSPGGRHRRANKLDRARPRLGVLRAALRFVRDAGSRNVLLEFDGGRLAPSTRAISVANAPYVGAAFAVAPGARLDDGLLDVAVLDRSTSLPRLLIYLALIAGGRAASPPPHTHTLRARWLRVAVGRRQRPLPVHADGVPVGATPATFEVAPAALRVVAGTPAEGGVHPWAPQEPVRS